MRASRIAMTALVVTVSALQASAQTKPYTPKNGVVNWKAVLLGGAFRVTTAVPLHGDFSRFDRVEIVDAESLIGGDAPPTVLHRLTEHLLAEFRKSGRFAEVVAVHAYERRRTSTMPVADGGDAFRSADSLDAPMRPAADMAAMDRDRAAAARDHAPDTLVVTDEVVDYARGNKLTQLLLLNLGNSLMTIRLSYFDKATGEELGRSVVSSDTSSKVVPSLLSPRTPLAGVAEGVVDQVTRRKVAAER
jgi:hypothetical protein